MRAHAAIAVALAAGVLALGGCGGGDDEPDRASTTKTTETGPTAAGTTSPDNRRSAAETKRATARLRAEAKRTNARGRRAARRRAARGPAARESKRARASTARLYRALHAGDHTAICRQLSARARGRLAKATRQPTCADAITGAAQQGRRARAGKVTDVTFQGKDEATATVSFAGGATGQVRLVEQRDGWRVDEFSVPAPAGAKKPSGKD